MVVPLVLLLILGSGIGVVLNRLTGAMSEVQSVSAAPQQVTISGNDFEDNGVVANAQPATNVTANGNGSNSSGPVDQTQVATSVTQTSDTEAIPPNVQAVTVDTAPALAALEEHGIVVNTDPGLLGDLQNGASNLTDIAGAGAAVTGARDSDVAAQTILVLGTDARPGEAIDIGVRADTIMVVRLNPEAGTCRVLNVLRDTWVNLPGYGMSKINHALAVGGIAYQQLVVEQTLGILIDHYALINFTGFQQVVDHFGSVEINVPEQLVYENGGLAFEPGLQTMDGEAALRYARARMLISGGGDQARIQRQWAVLRGVAQQAEGGNIVREINSLMPLMTDNFRTDLSVTQMTGLADAMSGRCTSQDVETDQLDGTGATMQDAIMQQPLYFIVVDDAVLREKVRWLMA